MRLGGRFALWFSITALVPIVAAALITREFLAHRDRADFEKRQTAAQAALDHELSRRRDDVGNAISAASSLRDEFVGALILNLEKRDGELLARERRELSGRAVLKKRGLGLDVFMVTDGNDRVLFSPHNPGLVDEVNPAPGERARALRGKTYYAREQVLAVGGSDGVESRTLTDALVVGAARITRERSQRLTVSGARIIRGSLMAPEPGRDSRVVDPEGNVLIASEADWSLVSAAVLRTPLPGPDGAPVAFVEIGISDAELKSVLRTVTIYSAGIAAAALAACILLGLIMGRRITRDLDQLVIGVQAAARGDLDHEVPVRTADEIGALADAVNLMMVDLKESKERLSMAERVAAWQEIARRLAHEIKNPLTPIQMSVETLRKTWKKKHPSFDEIFEESTATILEESARLKRIVSEFSEFARMPKPNKRRIDLNELVTQSTALYRGSVDLELSLGELADIEADRDSLSQVILNLVENARDAIATSGSRIKIETTPTRGGKAVALIVDDDGPGLPKEVKEKLFTPYFTTKHATGGSGLGLAIVHRIVSDHDGNILAIDSPLGGARFVVELPTATAGPDDLAASLTGQLQGR